LKIILLAVLLLSAAIAECAQAAQLRVAAASSLQFALAEVLKQYPGDAQIQPVYGASGNLFRQIMQGAPYDLFLSADAEFVDQLQHEKRTVGDTIVFGSGRLVWFRLAGDEADFDAASVAERAASQPGFRLAIANPRHAPYGRAAQQALESLGLWQTLQPNLVFGEKVSQAAMMVASGAASAGLISVTLAQSQRLQQLGTYTMVDSQHHEPLVLKAAVVTARQENQSAALDLLDFLGRPQATVIFREFGLLAE